MNIMKSAACRARIMLLPAGLVLFLSAFTAELSRAQSSHEVVNRPYWQHRSSHFSSLPDTEGEIVFLGDSITEGAEWNELTGMPHVINRGISGDTAWGILSRLDEVIKRRPDRVFLMIGVNDLSHGQTPEEVSGEVDEILSRLRHGSPVTDVFLQSVLPVENREGWGAENGKIRRLNEHFRALAAKHEATFIDVAREMTSETGELRPDLSLDGLHLNAAGYLTWLNVLQRYLHP